MQIILLIKHFKDDVLNLIHRGLLYWRLYRDHEDGVDEVA
jgi:hypothetical protein